MSDNLCENQPSVQLHHCDDASEDGASTKLISSCRFIVMVILHGFVVRDLEYISLTNSVAYSTLRLTISPKDEAVTCLQRCTIHSPD